MFVLCYIGDFNGKLSNGITLRFFFKPMFQCYKNFIVAIKINDNYNRSPEVKFRVVV